MEYVRYPRILNKLFSILREHIDSRTDEYYPFFIYCTYCRFSANSLHMLAKCIESLGYILIAKKSFKCPSNGIASMKNPDSFEYKTVMFFENRIDLSISNFSINIIDNVNKFYENKYSESHQGSFFDKLKINIVDKIEKARYPELQIDTTSCTKCGLCVKECPENNLLMGNDSIVIKDKYDCLHCLRCMHHCPKHSISFGELTKGPMRYTIITRNELYEKAKNTSLESPVPTNNKIKRKWALNNLKYWLFHFK